MDALHIYPQWWVVRKQSLKPATSSRCIRLAGSIEVELWSFDEVLKLLGALEIIGGILLVAIWMTPRLFQINHFRCLALHATHGLATHNSEIRNGLTATTSLVLHINHPW